MTIPALVTQISDQRKAKKTVSAQPAAAFNGNPAIHSAQIAR